MGLNSSKKCSPAPQQKPKPNKLQSRPPATATVYPMLNAMATQSRPNSFEMLEEEPRRRYIPTKPMTEDWIFVNDELKKPEIAIQSPSSSAVQPHLPKSPIKPQRRKFAAEPASRTQNWVIVEEKPESLQYLDDHNLNKATTYNSLFGPTPISPQGHSKALSSCRQSLSAPNSSRHSKSPTVVPTAATLSPLMSVNIFSQQSNYLAATETQVLPVYYVDLTELEHCSLQTNLRVSLSVERSRVRIVNDQICIHRIDEPINTSYAKEDILGTESILFSHSELLMAKYRGAYYFVDDKLYDEYTNLQDASDSECTAIRIQRQRIIANEKTHFLNVIELPNHSRTNRRTVIIDAYRFANDAWMKSGKIAGALRRYMVDPETFKLISVPNELVYAGGAGCYDEIYGEIDYECLDYAELQKHEFMKSFDRTRPMKMSYLPAYAPPEAIKEILHSESQRKPGANSGVTLSAEAQKKKNFILEISSATNGLHAGNYEQAFSTMIHLEDETERIGINLFNMANCELKQESSQKLYSTGLNMTHDTFEAFDAAMANKKIFEVALRFMVAIDNKTQTKSKKNKNDTTRGVVLRLSDGRLYMEMDVKLKHLGSDHLYYVQFLHTRLPYQMSQRALENVHKQRLYPFLFPSGPFGMPNGTNPKKRPKWFDSNLNPEQMIAVENIIHKSSSPYPFILFGPPGTGKTKTLVEAIAQIVSTSDAKILVCATSNSACDVLASRILGLLPHSLLYRLYSTMANVTNIDNSIRWSSNVDDGDAFYPSLDSLQKAQILVCTLVVAGRLALAGLPRKFPRHFDYVFIDECGSSDEASALIPIVGVCSEADSITANVILAGDPFQLRAIISSRMAQKMGYDISLIERLMRLDPYRRERNDSPFNNRYIVQLVKNYRSHAAILAPSNQLFYQSQLVPKADLTTIDWFLNTIILKSPQFPIVFKSVQGKCKRGDLTSLYNDEELHEILSVVRQLLRGHGGTKKGKVKPMRPVTIDDIGIISPYKRQCRKIVQACKQNGWAEMKIGSVEIFQGQEKPVIIVSTVRSRMNTIGFLDNWRRLNVLMTRAKCLLYIIGDPFTLALDDNWAFVLRYLLEHNALIQSKSHFSISATRITRL